MFEKATTEEIEDKVLNIFRLRVKEKAYREKDHKVSIISSASIHFNNHKTHSRHYITLMKEYFQRLHTFFFTAGMEEHFTSCLLISAFLHQFTATAGKTDL